MLYYGVITQVDAATGRVRVGLDTDDIVTDWLPVAQSATLTDKGYRMFDVNEHVAVLLDFENETGLVLAAVYNTDDAPSAPATGAGEHSLVLNKDGSEAVLLAASRAAGTATVRTKNKLALTSTAAAIELAAGTKVKITATGKIRVDAGGVNLHDLMSRIGSFLATHKHVVAGASTTVLNPADIPKAAGIIADIDLMLE